ncbi:DUF4198 domain-containing protein [Dethiosulfatarculus sandiegensis]|uniref:Nickel transporter n=1 Tax=Dethiosulfatarculus sandiegensis TaxID=1429043 RepID=A0A0D2J5J8_9BACT|nr:DUF4198 domain-containing protein [Dethiosulfatarculus sandiegensis]KIX10961.1 hypothetical protein X474_26515 [Dethiosulfatarculus sandiegensis]
MKKLTTLVLGLAMLFIAESASAHMFWVNAFKSEHHFPNYVTTTIGYGHALPIDDFLISGKDTIKVGEYFVAGPKGKRSDLHLAKPAYYKPEPLSKGLSAQPGSLSANKIILSKDAAKGTYQVAAVVEPTCFTIYKNQKGRTKFALKGMDEIKDLKKTILGMACFFSGKSFFTVGSWTKPEPLGLDLEILPQDDLSDVHVGDLVKFRVLLNGKPLSSSFKGIESISAQSPSFGASDGNEITCKLHNGMGKIRVPAAGQWVVKVWTQKKVSQDPKMAKFKNKAQVLYYASSVTFSVKP